jgi:hypothetical protein
MGDENMMSGDLPGKPADILAKLSGLNETRLRVGSDENLDVIEVPHCRHSGTDVHSRFHLGQE